MIHYHGTPVSGTGSDAIRLLSGRHALIPFARPDNLGIALEVCQSVVLDNSAFAEIIAAWFFEHIDCERIRVYENDDCWAEVF